MAINKNHLFEELNGVKCGIADSQVSAERAAFLQDLLEANGYTVVVVPSAAPKAPAAGTEAVAAPPERFTVGVTDVTFNPINAIFGRMLRTRNGHVVTLAYWQQRDPVSQDDIPYYEEK